VAAVAVPTFFALKVAFGLALIKMSARSLDAFDFASFSQLFLFSSLLNSLASVGMQNGVIRQVAVAPTRERIGMSLSGALLVWATACASAGAVLALSADLVSQLLTHTARFGGVIRGLIVGCCIIGAGQIFCSALTGLGRVGASMLTQAVGLVVGGVSALALLAKGDAPDAVLAFVFGSALTTPIAAVIAFRHAAWRRYGIGPLREEISALLSYSGSFLLAGSVAPIALFALRYIYSSVFGLAALNNWLVANRLSDVSTQLLGLFMAQWYLPTAARCRTLTDAKRAIGASFVVGTAVMAAFALAFWILSPVLVPLVLSRQYLSATPLILIYMIGDVCRVATSLADYTALARGKVWAYLGIELVSAGLLVVVTATLIAIHWILAPFVGYASTFALLTVAIWTWVALDRPSGRNLLDPALG
jgi:O-antigen/teichoic acid export membrane protein